MGRGRRKGRGLVVWGFKVQGFRDPKIPQIWCYRKHRKNVHKWQVCCKDGAQTSQRLCRDKLIGSLLLYIGFGFGFIDIKQAATSIHPALVQ